MPPRAPDATGSARPASTGEPPGHGSAHLARHGQRLVRAGLCWSRLARTVGRWADAGLTERRRQRPPRRHRRLGSCPLRSPAARRPPPSSRPPSTPSRRLPDARARSASRRAADAPARQPARPMPPTPRTSPSRGRAVRHAGRSGRCSTVGADRCRWSTGAYAPRAGGVGACTPPQLRATSARAPRRRPPPLPGALHLARRASWGATPAPGRRDRQPGAPPRGSTRSSTRWPPCPDSRDGPARGRPVATPGPGRRGRCTTSTDPNSTGDLGYDVLGAYVARALWSRRQLLEVMVDFWSNHLNVTCPPRRRRGTPGTSTTRDVIRGTPWGRYTDMLVAVGQAPGDARLPRQRQSATKDAPNENYGRELLELHTVGVDGGYTESDVRQSAARLLTGMSIDDESGEYDYQPDPATTGPVTDAGLSPTPNPRPRREGRRGLPDLPRPPPGDRAADRPQARGPLRRRRPPAALGRPAGGRLPRATTPTIAPVLRALFTLARVRGLGGREGQAAVRGHRLHGAHPRRPPTGPGTDGGSTACYWTARNAGQAPLGWPAPNGYPDVAPAWAGAGGTLAGWNCAPRASGWAADPDHGHPGHLPGADSLLPAALPATHGALVDAARRPPAARPGARRPRARRSAPSSARPPRPPAALAPTPPSAGGCRTSWRCCSTRPSSPPGEDPTMTDTADHAAHAGSRSGCGCPATASLGGVSPPRRAPARPARGVARGIRRVRVLAPRRPRAWPSPDAGYTGDTLVVL